jgi:hypothetical protein
LKLKAENILTLIALITVIASIWLPDVLVFYIFCVLTIAAAFLLHLRITEIRKIK